VEFKKALALRSQIRRAGWFKLGSRPRPHHAAPFWCASWRSARLPAAVLTEVPMRLIGLAVVLGLTLITPISAEAQSPQSSKIGKVGILTPAVEGDPSLMLSRVSSKPHYENLAGWRDKTFCLSGDIPLAS
jgi:hypothetical protein